MKIKNVNAFRERIKNALEETFLNVVELETCEYYLTDYNKDGIRKLENPIIISDKEDKSIYVVIYDTRIFLLIPDDKNKVYNCEKTFYLIEKENMDALFMNLAIEIYKIL